MATKKKKQRIVYLVGSRSGGLKFGGDWGTNRSECESNIREGIYPWDDPIIVRAVLLDEWPKAKKKERA